MDNHILIEGERVAKKGIISLFILGFLKMIAGVMTGMTVIIADAISTFTDTLGLFASYLGLKLSRKAATEEFSYGFYKIETFAALFISIGIIILGLLILRDSISIFFEPPRGIYRTVAIVITVIAIINSFLLSKKLKAIAEKTNSLSLSANAKEKTIDVIAGFGILLSIGANYLGIPYIEGLVSTVIAVFILKEGFLTGKESLFFLLDYWNDPELYDQIKNILSEEKGIVIKVKKLRLRRAGTFIFGEAFIEISPFADIQDLRSDLEILQKKIRDLNVYIRDFSIYTHISPTQDVKIAVPIESGETLESKVAPTLRKTKAYLFAEIKNGKIKKFYTKALKARDKKPVALAEFLKNENINILIDNKLNSLLYYNLHRIHHILIYPNFSDIKKVDDTIKLLLLDT